MRILELTLDTEAENLALDEALLDDAEENASQPIEVLRLWEGRTPAVIVGRSSQVEEEVNTACCHELSIPILRRCSGGASVMIGSGCLMYSLILSYERRPELRMIEQAHEFVLSRVARSLQGLSVAPIQRQGVSDLVIGDRKISGNSLRCKRNGLLYHGTILYGFPLELIGACLRTPPRQPEYRAGRPHEDFVANLPASVEELRDRLRVGWSATSAMEDWPAARTQRLLRDRYSQSTWHLRR